MDCTSTCTTTRNHPESLTLNLIKIKVMTLEFTQNQQALLLDALHTRLQRIDQMIRLFEEDNDSRAKRMAEVYSQEYMDVEYLLEIIDRAGR